MIQSTLKLSRALMIGLTAFAPLKATDLCDQDPKLPLLIKTIVNYENGSKRLTPFWVHFECDTPILEALYHAVVPTHEQALEFFKHVKRNYPVKFEELEDAKNHSINILAKELLIDNKTKDMLTIRAKNLTVLPRILGSLNHLRWIDLSFNQLTHVETLRNHTNLTTLALYKNPLTQVGAISDLKKLTRLYLSKTLITDFNPLKHLTALTFLHLRHNKLKNIDFLSSLINLSMLNLSDNLLTHVDPLKNLTKLSWIQLDQNQIEDLKNVETLGNLRNLRNLYLGSNPVTNAPQNHPAILNLFLGETKIFLGDNREVQSGTKDN